MRDLTLWHRLGAGGDNDIDVDRFGCGGPGLGDVEPIDGEELAGQLLALARAPSHVRAPFFARLMRWTRHEQSAIRAGALAALAGAHGYDAWCALVAGLDDDDELVRRTAVAALRTSARHAPMRYAHALFHSRADVRRCALDGSLPHDCKSLVGYLRADPEIGERAASFPWPREPLPLAADLYRRGLAAADVVVELVIQDGAAALRDYGLATVGRSTRELDRFLAEARAHRAPAPPRENDALDVLVDAVAAAPPRAGAAANALLAAVADRGRRRAPRRLLVAVLGCAARRGAFDDRLAAMAAALEPNLLEFASAPTDRLPALARGVFEGRQEGAPLAGTVEDALAGPWVRDASGAVHLPLAVALVSRASVAPTRTLARRLGDAAIVDALCHDDDLTAWDWLCQLPGESKPRSMAWLRAVAKRDPARHAALVAVALAHWAGNAHRVGPLVDALDNAADLAAGVEALAGLMGNGFALTDARLTALCDEVVGLFQPPDLGRLLGRLLAAPDEPHLRLAIELARRAETEWVADALAAVAPTTLGALLIRGPGASSPLTWAHDLALAERLADSGDAQLASWAQRLIATTKAPVEGGGARARGARSVSLSEAERDAIATAVEGDLERALAPVLRAPAEGLAPALARRPPPTRPHLPVCVALLGCRDPLEAVSLELGRFGGDGDEHDAGLDHAVATLWGESKDLAPVGHAFLFRWEAHLFRFADWVEAEGGLLPCARRAAALPTRWVRRVFWEGLAHLSTVLRYRDRDRLARMASEGLAGYLAESLDGEPGRSAAAMLVALVEVRLGDLAGDRLRAIALDKAPDCDVETRALLRRLVRLEGVPKRAPRQQAPFDDALRAVREARCTADLLPHCRHPARQVVEEAVLRLLELGEAGERALATLAGELLHLPQPGPVAQSVPLWSDAAAVAAVRCLADAAETVPEVRFRLALGLFERGETEYLVAAFAAACAPADAVSWFARDDWSAVVVAAGEAEAAAGLAASPHHRAATPAVEWLLEHGGDEPRVHAALRAYLDVDGTRPLSLRRRAARALVERFGDWFGAPILLELAADAGEGDPDWLVRLSRGARRASLVAELVNLALCGGRGVCTEARALALARCSDVPGPARLAACEALLTRGLDAGTRRLAAQHLTAGQQAKLDQIARSFAWGVRRSQELTGSLFRIHMTSAEADFGHTYLDRNRVFVSALPLLRAERDGKDIVEGLILHELGHHMFHRGDREDAVWARAERDGLGRLLNLVADEHLERNLRARDPDFGDRLKKLDAYAFLHAVHDLSVEHLLGALLGSAAEALRNTRLDVAFDDGCVRLRRGDALGELDRMGHPLARFTRALRMGLGNRHADPVIAEALDLFGKSFRKLDMEGLYDVTRRLAGLFGGAVAVASVFGGPEDVPWGARDNDVHGAGIDDDILQREVERVLDPGDRRARRPGERVDRLQINVSPNTDFDRIHYIERVRGGEKVYRECAPDVRRHAAQLRALLRALGLQWESVGARVQGRALDRTRLRALVTRGDPRLLRARQPVRRNDLFLGVVIDCSSSMVAGRNIDRAQRFAVLIAEAVRELRGVDARFFGFNDSVIFDAGTAAHCAVGALRANGGNNDAAGLYHAALEAERSRRRARVLVMISDGLPTECSTEALRELVGDLGRRRGICCAQVAVRPLDEVCFPHYVVLDEELDVAVARFGGIVGDLARRTLSR